MGPIIDPRAGKSIGRKGICWDDDGWAHHRVGPTGLVFNPSGLHKVVPKGPALVRLGSE